MASSVSALSSQNSTPGTSSSSSSSSSPAPNEQMFLQLLVSQIQNQDPLNPTDSTQFVSQLAQFSELEQVIAIRGDLDTMSAKPASTSTSDPTQSSTSTNSSSNSTNNSQSTNPFSGTSATGQTQS